jgi:cell division protein ZapD
MRSSRTYPVKKRTLYEQPLNERIRNFLRLEHLFAGVMYHLKGPAEWDSRAVIDSLIEILDFIGRIDFKAELIKDLEHHAQILERWQRTPNVDNERIGNLLGKIKSILEKFAEGNAPLGTTLTQHQLLNVIRQRNTIAGGTCRCDLPNYHHWLHRNPKQRQHDLNEWLMPLEPLREAVDLNLYLIRNNTTTSLETAVTGFFQSKLDVNATYQLIQVALPIESPYYPEINGGKQRFTIRFFEQSHVEERPLQTEQDVNFELCCCMI